MLSSKNEPLYGVETQNKIILTCYIIHNYLMGVDPDMNLLLDVDAELASRNDRYNEPCELVRSEEDAKEGERLRDSIAATMWLDYVTLRR